MDATCSIEGCDRIAHARGFCAPHYSTWYRGEHGRTTFQCICVVCGTAFTSFVRIAKFCSTGANSCEAASKSLLPRSLRDSPLFNPHREPTKREVAAYRRVLRNDPCAYCGSEKGGALDHIVPRSEARSSGWRNLTGACNRCNGIKHTQPLLLALLWIPVVKRYHDLRRQLYPAPA